MDSSLRTYVSGYTYTKVGPHIDIDGSGAAYVAGKTRLDSGTFGIRIVKLDASGRAAACESGQPGACKSPVFRLPR